MDRGAAQAARAERDGVRFITRWRTDDVRVSFAAELQQTLGEAYEIESELRSGGMSRVYLARDKALDRRVVIKVLAPDLAGTIDAERFRREIRYAALVQHPHIVPILTAGGHDHILYYTMPFVGTESLRTRLQREPQMSIEDAVSIACDIASALDCAHRRGIVHRDVKPENILLEDGQAVVSDFGIAKAISHAAGERITATGITLGTPAYMSPEQASAEPELDGRSDVYSLGCVLFEMLTGQPPFTGPTAQVIISRRFAHPAPRVRAVRAEATPALDDAVARALQLKPSDRFATAAEFEDALRRSVPGTVVTPTSVPGALEVRDSAPAAVEREVVSSPRARGLVIAGLALAALAVLLWVVLAGGR